MVKRPILIACIGYIIGIIYGLYFVKLSIALFFLISIITIILHRNLDKNIKRYIKILIPKSIMVILIISFILGVIYTSILSKKYIKIYEITGPVEMMGIVQKIKNEEYSNKYILKVDKINGRYYTNVNIILYTKKNQPSLEYGDYIKVLSEYSKPNDSRNYKGFSYKNYLKQNNIYGTAMAIDKIQVIEKEKITCIEKAINGIRTKIINEVNSNLSNNAGSIFLGILIGERTQISEELNGYFRQSNMAHILAISGAHVSYIMIALNVILGKTQKKFYLISTVLILIFFMILTEFPPSVVRACVMTILMALAKLIHRKADVYTNFSLSAILILIYNPYTILNIGFQLTYLGTLGIALFSPVINEVIQNKIFLKEHKESKLYLKRFIIYKFKKFISNSIIISIAVQILIFPIILINFNTISYNFLISGIIATPIFALIMIIGIFFLILNPIKNIFYPIIEILVNILIHISIILSKLPFSNIMIPTPNILWVISYYTICIIILILKNKTFIKIRKYKSQINKVLKKLLLIILIVCLVFEIIIKLKYNELRIYFIDVGQGDSTLIVTPKNKVILLDGGGSNENSYDVGKNILIPYLLDRGIWQIDYVIISHFDSDHVRTD